MIVWIHCYSEYQMFFVYILSDFTEAHVFKHLGKCLLLLGETSGYCFAFE